MRKHGHPFKISVVDDKMDHAPTDLPDFTVKFSHFKTVEQSDKQDILKNRKALNTNKATKCWVNCLMEYLLEKNYPVLEDITTDDLPSILSDFYTEVSKKKSSYDGSKEYKNTTLKCIRSEINRYFRETRSLDIISDPRFISSNEMFQGM